MGRLGQMFSRFRSARAGSDSQPEKPEELREMRWVVAGLGNPGEQYHRSGHNIGFTVIDRLAEKCGARLDRRKFKGISGEARIGPDSVILVKPQTYYNLSGECVAALLGYYKIPAERLIVVHDEIDLEPRQLRLKRGGGDGGHNGLKSITKSLGSKEYLRVRFGIGRPPGRQDPADFVLKPFSSAEAKELELNVDRAADAVESLLTGTLEAAQNLHHAA